MIYCEEIVRQRTVKISAISQNINKKYKYKNNNKFNYG